MATLFAIEVLERERQDFASLRFRSSETGLIEKKLRTKLQIFLTPSI